MYMKRWANKKLREIADKLPKLVVIEANSFNCGHTMGYKDALLDLIQFIEERNEGKRD